MVKLKKCSVCKKLFVPAPLHMYKTKNKNGGIKMQCCYTCYRQAGGDNGKSTYARKEK